MTVGGGGIRRDRRSAAIGVLICLASVGVIFGVMVAAYSSAALFQW